MNNIFNAVVTNLSCRSPVFLWLIIIIYMYPLKYLFRRFSVFVHSKYVVPTSTYNVCAFYFIFTVIRGNDRLRAHNIIRFTEQTVHCTELPAFQGCRGWEGGGYIILSSGQVTENCVYTLDYANFRTKSAVQLHLVISENRQIAALPKYGTWTCTVPTL